MHAWRGTWAIADDPSLAFQRQTWWDHLLSIYSPSRSKAYVYTSYLYTSKAYHASESIPLILTWDDCMLVVGYTSLHCSQCTAFRFRSVPLIRPFINIPLFFGSAYFISVMCSLSPDNNPRAISSPANRQNTQPSLILAALAMSTLMQSPSAANPWDQRRKAMVRKACSVLLYDVTKTYP